MTKHDPKNYSPSDRGEMTPSTSWWQKKSIRWKATVTAIALGTIPTIILGSVAYVFASRTIEREIVAFEKTVVSDLQNQVNIFMRDRLGDIQTMANLDIFTNPKLSKIATKAEKSAALQQIQDNYQVYNSIAIFDLQGDVIAQTEGKPLGNHRDRGYVKAALDVDSAIISQPRVSTSSGIFSVYTAAPIHDKVTGETIGFVRARIPVKVLKNLLLDYSSAGSQYYLLNGTGDIFLGSQGEYIIKTLSNESQIDNKSYDYEAINASQVFSGIEELLSTDEVSATTLTNSKTQAEQLLVIAPPNQLKGLPELNWKAVIATNSEIIFASQRKLRQIFILGTGLAALIVGAVAHSLVNRALRPILLAATTVADIGQGNLEARIEVLGADEIARLSGNINLMAARLKNLLQKQTSLTRQAEILRNIAVKFTVASQIEDVINIAVREGQETLQVSRAIYYRFNEQWQGKIVAESVLPEFPISQGAEIYDPCFAEKYVDKYQQGKVAVTPDINKADLTECHLSQLEPFQVRASLVAPVLVQDKLDGLLIAHQCLSPRDWQQNEVEFWTQLANQIGFAFNRLTFIEEQKQAKYREKQAKEAIQSRALDLLKEVYEVAEGNLTIRARVTEDEIGTIADSYNSTIESLQKLVNRVKNAAEAVKMTTNDNEQAIQKLTREAIVQAEEMNVTLGQVTAMKESIASVTNNAAKAQDAVKLANESIARGDSSMNQTVAEIKAIETTVIEAATKIKQLGDSSEEISQAVELIGRFAAQTHLLALKASIEAARAGEQGKGFAVIADEVRSLATQSAAATAEIDNLVTKIQLETSEVVTAMNMGTQQVAAGTRQIAETRQNLDLVTSASQEISDLVREISAAASLQSTTSAIVNQNITKVATIAQDNSLSATQVARAIEQLSDVAEKLQAGIGKFKT